MLIRKATCGDLPRMMEIYRQSQARMVAGGNPSQWPVGHPSEEMVRRDIEREVSYVVEDSGTVVGVFAFVPGADTTYRVIEQGAWIDDTLPYCTLHRMGRAEEAHGIAAACFEWCSERCSSLRADTHRDNLTMQHCLVKAGFRYCGIIHVADGTPRLAYQKIL